MNGTKRYHIIKKRLMEELKISRFRIGLYFIFFIVVLLSIILLTVRQNEKLQQQSRADTANVVETNGVAAISETQYASGSSQIDLYVDPTKKNEPLYTTEATGAGAIYELMRENPTITDEVGGNNVKGVNTIQSTTPRRLLPANFDRNSRLIRQSSDKKLPFHGVAERDHFYYNQQINGVPVYGSMVRFDLQNNNQVVGVEGDFLTNEVVSRGAVTEDQALQTALKKASLDAKRGTALSLCPDKKIEKSIVNSKLLGLSSDEVNHETFAVEICNSSLPIFFDKTYYINTQTGEIQLERDNVYTVLNRIVNSCRGGGCTKARNEGEPASSDADVDNSYDILGEVYNYYFNNFQRDSFDGRGATIKANVHYPFSSPNAAWTGRDMIAGSGMIARDVWGHELTHALTQYTAGLPGDHQGGSMNESLSDIAGYALDSGNWTMGETTVIGVIRDISDPARISRDGLGPQPDRIFASGYYCGSADSYGTHHNNGVLNKAFYLMTAGGTFNGCTITGITKEKSLAVIYKAQTTYLRPSSNFKDMYDAMLKACADLYGSLDSTECKSVKAAGQATEMDQQTAGSQTGAKCKNVAPKTPECAGVAPEPTSSTTTTPISTPPAGGSPSVAPTAVPTSLPQETPIASPIPTDQPLPTVQPTQATPITLNIKLLLQGIAVKPKRLTTIPVKISLAQGETGIIDSKTVDFTSDDHGVWSGTASFDASPGDGYTIFVKGSMHIQKKICHSTPQESYPGTYRCAHAVINLSSGDNNLDFSNILQLIGDLPDQDGVVNSYDISLIRNNIGATDPQTTQFCDVNYDGICNSQDYSLIIASLSVRVDEE